MKEVEIQIEDRREFDDYKVKQSFIFNNKDKNTKYLFDNRFLLANMFSDLIRKNNIASDEYQFINEEVLKDRVVLNFVITKGTGNKLNNHSWWITLADVVPDNCGCEFCVYKKPLPEDMDQNFFRCIKKEKCMSSDVKKCSCFRQRDLKSYISV